MASGGNLLGFRSCSSEQKEQELMRPEKIMEAMKQVT